MDGNPSKGQQPPHVAMPVSLHNTQPVNVGPGIPNTVSLSVANHLAGAKSMENESLEMMSHVQELLNQLFNRGVNSMLVTVGPLGEVGLHGSHKGQAFLKDNAEFVDRFAKNCTDDVWALIGVQKRFIDIGRSSGNTSKSGQGDYPLDFSHERGSFFPGQQQNDSRPSSQDNTFVQGIISQGMSQSKSNYQANSFAPSSFSQYGSDGRPNYPTFFQGGFSQGVQSSESFPQPSFMPSMDSSTNKENYGNIVSSVLPMATTSSAGPPTTVALPQGSEKTTPVPQSEEDLIKEMLNSTPLQDVIKGTGQKQNKEKTKSLSSSDHKRKEAADKRKRERRPETWQRNIKKKLKTEGKAYINAKGNIVPAKELKSVDCDKCKLKCTSKINEETRQKIFDWFWALGSYTAQKEFVVSRVSQIATKTTKRRHVHRLFSFEINGKYEPVCKPFFSKTLGIGDSYIYKAFEQKARDLFVQDGRGKHAPVNKTSHEQVEFLHRHLDRFLHIYPTNKPLPKSIHAVKWYDEYVKLSEEREKKFVSKHIYRKLFQKYTKSYPPNPEKKKPGAAASTSFSSDDSDHSSSLLALAKLHAGSSSQAVKYVKH